MSSVSDALTYLGGQEVFWINLDRSTERRDAWHETMEPLFTRATRIKAWDWQDVSDEVAFDFIEDWHIQREMHKSLNVFMHQPQSRTKYRVPTAKANYAIRRSHLDALHYGSTRSNRCRFLVAEDDICPRNALWVEHVPTPPLDADVAIWSGGLPMAAVRTDDADFKRGLSFSWIKITRDQVFNTLGAGLYEVNRKAAARIISEVVDTPMGPFDHAWGHAFRSGLTVYRLKPNAFPQAGPSVRNNADRKPITERMKIRS